LLNALENADLVMVSIDGYVISRAEILPFMHRIKARTVLLAHYTIPGQAVWAVAPTVEYFISKYASDVKVLRSRPVIDLYPGMPEQIAVLQPHTLLEYRPFC
jgi:hypothetical protein